MKKLTEYRKKRNFGKTAEPDGEDSRNGLDRSADETDSKGTPRKNGVSGRLPKNLKFVI